MKKTFTLLFIALSALLFTGCYSDEIRNLQEQIDALKSEQIKTIDEQVSSIKTSLASLQYTDKELQLYISQLQIQQEKLEDKNKEISEKIEQLKKSSNDNKEILSQLEEYKSLVTEQISSLKSTIETLQEKDKNLQSQIDSLKTYTETEIQKINDWISATSSTLEQYNATASIVATISAQIETINSDISLLKSVTGQISKEELDKAISDSESSIKNWVNSLLEGYYTAEQTEAKLTALKEELSKSGSTDMEKIIKEYEVKLTQAKAEITEAYTSAIAKAINDYNGTITSRIASEISTVNGKISSLRSDITALETRMTSLENRVDALEELVNNLKDGKTGSDVDGTTTLGGETTIDGITWMNYNVGANKDNIQGLTWTYSTASKLCPTGYKLPNSANLYALSMNHSDWTTYMGMEGMWFSGYQQFSEDVPAIFLPKSEISQSTQGRYWSSDTIGAILLFSADTDPYIFFKYSSTGCSSVRCIKDE